MSDEPVAKPPPRSSTRPRGEWRPRGASAGKGLFISLIGASLNVLFIIRDRIVEPELFERIYWVRLLMVLALLTSWAVLWRGRDLVTIRIGNLIAHVTLVTTGAWVAPTLTQFWATVAAYSLLIWGPSTAFTWPLSVGIVMFGSPPIAFVASHLIQRSDREPRELVAASFYLSAAAILSTAGSHFRLREARAAFAAREALARTNAELEETLEEKARTQSALVKSEKLASLGQLVAGVAHELNSPLGAIHASATNLHGAIERSAHELVPAIGALTEAQREMLQGLLERALATDTSVLTSREERQRRRALTAALEDAGLDDAREVASRLVEMGVDASPEELLPLLRATEGGPVVERAHDLVMLQRNASNIQVASGRAAAIVGALKRYAHPGQLGGEKVEAPVGDHLDTVLTLHRNQLKHNVELERDYASPGVIWARHDQLDQVWTNLVHNALQAMDGAGSLRVALRDDGAFLVVEITDSGPGVPEDARERIFDPFYTTKSVGEGSGLGLSICKDIVEGHGGTITLESQPGRTTFAVRLPKQRSSLSPSTRPPAMA